MEVCCTYELDIAQWINWWWPCGDEAHDENYIVTILRNDYTSASTLKRERERKRVIEKETLETNKTKPQTACLR